MKKIVSIRNKTLLIAFIFLFHALPFAISGWTDVQPPLTHDDLFAVDAQGAILMTAGANGQVWECDTIGNDLFPRFTKEIPQKILAVNILHNGCQMSAGENGYCVLYRSMLPDGPEILNTGVTATLRGVWLTSTTTAYLVGDGGLILSWADNGFQAMNSGVTVNLNALTELSDGSIIAVGDQGTILRKNGETWEIMDCPVTTDLLGISRSHGTTTFACGRNGTILIFDGAVWNVMDSGTSEDLHSISLKYKTGFITCYAAGDNGTLLYFDGTSWSSMSSPTNKTLYSVFAGSGPAAEIPRLCVGQDGVILILENNVWEEYQPGHQFHCMQAVDESDMYAGGTDGRLVHWDGTGWKTIPTGTFHDVTSIWIHSPQEIYLGFSYLNSYGYLMMWNGTEMTVIGESNFPFHAIDGIPPNHLYYLGQYPYYNGVIGLFDGAEWTSLLVDTGIVYDGILCNADNDLYAIGTHYDVFAPPVGPVIVTPIGGCIRHFDGTDWTIAESEMDGWNCILQCSDGQLMAAAESSGWINLTYFTSNGFYPILPARSGHLHSLLEFETGGIFAAGSSCQYFDGWTWNIVDKSGLPVIKALWGKSEEDFWAAGGTRIMHWTGPLPIQEKSGAYLSLNSHEFHGGDLFQLKCCIRNTSGNDIQARLFIILDAGDGDYFFYPSWKPYPDIDYQSVHLNAHESREMTIIQCECPDVSGPFRMRWYSGLLDENNLLIGDYDWEDFGWY